MARLIDADDLKEKLRSYTGIWLDEFKFSINFEAVLHRIDFQPTIEAEPVRHGEWCHLCGDEWCCSECGLVVTTEGSWEHPSERGYEHCYKCGAKMDGKKEEEKE